MERPDSARSTVARWRDEIERAVALSAGGPLTTVLEAQGCGHCYVVKVLDAHPCLGKVKGRRLLGSLGIPVGYRMEQLRPADRSALAGECRCSRE